MPVRRRLGIKIAFFAICRANESMPMSNGVYRLHAAQPSSLRSRGRLGGLAINPHNRPLWFEVSSSDGTTLSCLSIDSDDRCSRLAQPLPNGMSMRWLRL